MTYFYKFSLTCCSSNLLWYLISCISILSRVKLFKPAAVLPGWCCHLYYSLPTIWSTNCWWLPLSRWQSFVGIYDFLFNLVCPYNWIELFKIAPFPELEWVHFKRCKESLVCGFKFHSTKGRWGDIPCIWVVICCIASYVESISLYWLWSDF